MPNAPWMPPDPTTAAAYGGLTNLGLNILANSNTPGGFGSILGKSMLGAQQNWQQQQQQQMQLAQAQMQMAQMQQEMPMRMAWLNAQAQRYGLASPQGQSGAAGPSAGAPAASPAAPAGAPSAMPVSAQGGGAAPSTSPIQAPWMPPGGAQAQGADPMTNMGFDAFGAGLGLPGAREMMDVDKTQLQYDPATATRMAVAKGDIAQDQALLRQAQAAGNPTLIQGATMKLLNDLKMVQVGQFNGNVTTMGGITPAQLGVNTFSPQTGLQTIGGRASLIPGAAQALQGKAAAEAVGHAAGETVEVSDAQGNKYQVPKTAIVGGAIGAAPAGAQSATASSAPSGLSGLGPSRSKMLAGNADTALEANKEFQGQADAGQQMLAQIQALRGAASQFDPGQFANGRATMLNFLNSTGLITPDEKNQLGSYQEGQKIAIQLQAAATKQLGSREAAQVFTYMGKSLPNLTMSADGLQKVMSWQEGISRYNIARAQMANQFAQNNDATSVNQVRDLFIAKSNPLFYVLASSPPSVQQELLTSMGDQKTKFLQQWNAAANVGLAPRPGDYQGQR